MDCFKTHQPHSLCLCLKIVIQRVEHDNMPMQEAVRKSAAAQLHQLAMLVPPDGGSQLLVKPLLTLLCDLSPAVLLSVLVHLPIVMSRIPLDASNYRDIVSALVVAENASTRQWRLAVAIAEAIRAMVDEVRSRSFSSSLLLLFCCFVVRYVYSMERLLVNSVQHFWEINKQSSHLRCPGFWASVPDS